MAKAQSATSTAPASSPAGNTYVITLSVEDADAIGAALEHTKVHAEAAQLVQMIQNNSDGDILMIRITA